jgi:DNA-directed RNA polymerase subunit RPC12/RpoP
MSEPDYRCVNCHSILIPTNQFELSGLWPWTCPKCGKLYQKKLAFFHPDDVDCGGHRA